MALSPSSATVNGQGELLGDPAVNLRGVVTTKTQEQWERSTIPVVKKSVRDRFKEVVENPDSKRPTVNWTGLQSRLEEDLRRFYSSRVA